MTNEPGDLPSILFLCLGNICRSPLAEGAVRAALAAEGLAARIDSAGTGDWHIGKPPDPRARAEARRRGINIDDLRARQLVSEDFFRFDLILAADQQNLLDARRMAPPGASARLSLMLDMVPGRAGENIADPYFGEEDGFAETWADVSALAQALLSLSRG